MTCFVKYFRLFANPSWSEKGLAKRLAEREEWDEAAALAFRVRGARRIINAGRAVHALKLIKDSKRLAHLRPQVDALLKEVESWK